MVVAVFSYISREELEKRGLSKLVQQADARMAALAAGTDNRPVTTKEIQAHLDDFALAKEFSVYGKIGGLSGGQKVTTIDAEWQLTKIFSRPPRLYRVRRRRREIASRVSI